MTAHKITDREPVFPCWMWMPHADGWAGCPTARTWNHHLWSATHWHPDQPAAPTCVPGEAKDPYKQFAEDIGWAQPTPEAVPMWVKEAAIELHSEAWHGLTYNAMIELTAKAIARHAPPPVGEVTDTGAKNDDYWRGYRARLDEETATQPEPKNPTLWRYFQNALEKNVTFHSVGVNKRPDGGFHFYIHPQSVSGDTQDYLLWPDPFSWSDMLVNRLDSPPPDVAGFKKALAAMRSGREGEKS